MESGHWPAVMLWEPIIAWHCSGAIGDDPADIIAPPPSIMAPWPPIVVPIVPPPIGPLAIPQCAIAAVATTARTLNDSATAITTSGVLNFKLKGLPQVPHGLKRPKKPR